MKKQYVWVLGGLLLLVSLACSLGGVGGGTAQPPEGVATEEPTEVSTESPATEEAEPEIAPDALAGLESYRARITWEWTPEGEETEVFVVEQEETRNPPAKRYVISQDGETTEWVQIEDTAWICFSGSCVQTQENPEDLASEFGQGLGVDPGVYFGGEKDYVGDETINGINTRHYVLHLSPTEALALVESDVTELRSEAWVADEPDLPTFLVRFLIEWKGVRDEHPGEGRYLYEVYDVNQPITIEPPESAPAGLPEDVPTYPNAQDIVMMAGMFSFSTPDEVSVVADFYETQLPEMGWTQTESSDLGGMVMQTWMKDGRTLSLMISSEDEGTSVMITLEE